MTGLKTVENRTWFSSHTGPLLIHVSKSTRYLDDPTSWEKLLPDLEESLILPRGVIIGQVEMLECLPVDEVADNPFATGPWCFVLASPEMLSQPVHWRGQQGLFDVPDDFNQRIRRSRS